MTPKKPMNAFRFLMKFKNFNNENFSYKYRIFQIRWRRYVWGSSKKYLEQNKPPDNNNMCSWAMRSMLIEIDNQLILIDTGIGNKQSEKFLAITIYMVKTH